MSDKKTKVDCCLTTRGTKQANAKVVDDLTVPDPEPAIREQILRLQSELQLLESQFCKGGIKMPEAKKMAFEIRAKKAMISELQTRSDQS